VKRATNRLYILNLDVNRPMCLARQSSIPAWRWQSRYGHLNFRGLRKLAKGEMVRGLPQIDHVDQVYDSCLTGKQKHAMFPFVSKFRAKKLEPVHGDLCSPVTPTTLGGMQYFFLLANNVSRYIWLILLATKDQVLGVFTTFQTWAEAKAGRRIGTLHSDRGREFTACGFIEHYSKHGVQRHLTAPYTLEQNDIIKRRNQLVLGMSWSMLTAMSMPNWFCGEVVSTAVFILNRSPTQSVEDKTSYKVCCG
jgi:transposase InsO family protein